MGNEAVVSACYRRQELPGMGQVGEDLGVVEGVPVPGLNAYGHDSLRGLSRQICLDSQFYGFSLG